MEVELDKEINFEENSTPSLYDFHIIDCSIPYSEFFERYLMKNQACLIRNVSHNWESSKLWVENDLPNFLYLQSCYADLEVNVQDCYREEYQPRNKNKWKFHDYLKYWKECIDKKYSKEEHLYYLKDWHLKNELPDDTFYEVPLYFASDWLNEYLVENSKDDYRFIYMGVKGTWTPFHVDVMTSYSWSTNICGQKRWILFPPGEEEHLHDKLGNLPHDITDLKHDRMCFEIIQSPGDAIFVPSNWHHQVWNLKDTISINHNWINGCNLKNVWCAIANNLVEVKDEIKDCEDMDDFLDHCQVLLRASIGMDFANFYEFILYIANKRIKLLTNDTRIVLPENRTLGRNHARFDLYRIKETLSLLIDHKDIVNLSSFKNVNPVELFNDIHKILVNKT